MVGLLTTTEAFHMFLMRTAQPGFKEHLSLKSLRVEIWAGWSGLHG